LQRRQFLNQVAGTGLGLSLGNMALAQTAAGTAAASARPRLLVVFMRGGYDAANLLVPVSSPFYYEARPNIAVPRPDGSTNAALSLTPDWGLHPALASSIYPLYQKRQALFIPFAGTDDLTRSHFETQDSIEMGQALNGTRDYQSGFLNRLVAVLGEPAKGKGAGRSHPIAFTDQLSTIYRGNVEVPNVALRGVGRPALDARQSSLVESMYARSNMASKVQEGFAVRDEVAREMVSEMDAAGRNAITAKGFELEARRMAKLMREQFDLGFVDVGGWDTHVGEGAATGYLASRLDELGRGLAGFADEMGPAWNNTVVVVLSEFGRTFRENGNRGTDHGHGSVYWVLGGNLHGGGQVLGDQVAVSRNTLFQDRDFPVLNEYRSVFGGLFQRLYGLNGNQLGRVFAGVTPKDLALV